MKVLIGVKEDLSRTQSGSALETFSHDAGVRDVRVSGAHPHLMFVEYDENQLQRVDIISHMDQVGLHGKVCGC